MPHEHNYKVTAVWTGNKGDGTKNVRTYDRSHTVSIEGKPELFLTTDNPFVGDKSKLNPEDLLVSAISSCHMLSYLYVCSLEGIVITAYTDNATGIMIETGKWWRKFQRSNFESNILCSRQKYGRKSYRVAPQSSRNMLYSQFCEF
jgi:organic hydroperoxide reductase OsmC/OhrA